MGAEPITDWQGASANDLASALAWWCEAGVDALVEEAPRDWLAAPVAAPVAAAAPPASTGQQEPSASLPASLDAFFAWRQGQEAPEAAWHGPHLPASGPSDARVMILVDCPERGDGDEGRLMSGDVGRLFDRMLAAIGLDRESVHLAALCAKRPVGGQVPRDGVERLGEIARHHVSLVRPRRLMVMGNAASRVILGTDVREARGGLRPFNHKEAKVEVVASFHPRMLLERPAAKAEAWRDLQWLIEGMEQ